MYLEMYWHSSLTKFIIIILIIIVWNIFNLKSYSSALLIFNGENLPTTDLRKLIHCNLANIKTLIYYYFIKQLIAIINSNLLYTLLCSQF